MGNLQIAFDSVVAACNDPRIGYSQGSRTTIKLGQNYNTYCDCSSLLSWALTRAGYFSVNPWFATSNERSKLADIGWTQVSLSGQWQPGDILWRSGHTEMVYTGGTGGGVTMGAHSARYNFTRQVSINTTKSNASIWSELWRDTSSPAVGTYSWIQVETAQLPTGDMDNNAICVYSYLSREGWSNAAIAGVLGNMAAESSINPARWQGDTIGSGGYGLVQWTPASNYINWAAANNIDRTDADENGNGQLEYLISTWSSHWIPTSEFTYTYAQFIALTDYAEATKAFLYEYERPGVPRLQERLDAAERYYNMIENGEFPSDPGGGGTIIGGIQIGGIINELHRRRIFPGRL